MGTPSTNTPSLPVLAEASEQVAVNTKSHNVLKIPRPKHLAFVLGECQEGRSELACVNFMDPDLPAPQVFTEREGRKEREENKGGKMGCSR